MYSWNATKANFFPIDALATAAEDVIDSHIVILVSNCTFALSPGHYDITVGTKI